MTETKNEPAPQSAPTDPAATDPAATDPAASEPVTVEPATQAAPTAAGLAPGETNLTPPLQPCPCLGERCAYVDPDGVTHAAVITHVWNPDGLVSLTIFADGRPPAHVANVVHDESGSTPNTWHWPVRPEPAA